MSQSILETVMKGDPLQLRMAFVADTVGATHFCFIYDFFDHAGDARCNVYKTIDSINDWPYTISVETELRPCEEGQQLMCQYLGDVPLSHVEYMVTITRDGWLIVSMPFTEVAGNTYTYRFATWGEYKQRVLVVTTADGKRMLYDVDRNRLIGEAEKYAVAARTNKGVVYFAFQLGLLGGIYARAVLIGVVAAAAAIGVYKILEWLGIVPVSKPEETIKAAANYVSLVIGASKQIGDPQLRELFIRQAMSVLGEVVHNVASPTASLIETLKTVIWVVAAVAVISLLLRR